VNETEDDPMPQVEAFLKKQVVALNGFQVTVGTLVLAAVIYYAFMKFKK